jgi:sodium-dependent dicarboxylate transporter 2/3/5
MRARSALLTAASVLLALLVAAVVRGSPGLSPAADRALFVLVLAAALWISEAMPAFAVAVLVIALEVLLLGRPGGVFAATPNDWQRFVIVLGDPIIWLFFGGFVLAAAAAKTGLDRLLAVRVLAWSGPAPGGVLLGVLGLSFAFSMFMSNTATAAMMLAVVAPVVAATDAGDPFGKALLLAVAFGANVGGMGTIVGTPPNAIAVGLLGELPGQRIDFLQWILLGLPPSLVLAGVTWAYLRLRYASGAANRRIAALKPTDGPPSAGPPWQRRAVAVTFAATVLLWMTGQWHRIPATAVALAPIVVFTSTGILDGRDIRSLSWDVLLLMAGGLALGVAVKETGLAEWLLAVLPLEGMGTVGATVMISYAAVALSNFMSNTAAANILLPIGMALMSGLEAHVAVPIALAASAAMCLPISTPPNAIVFSAGRLESRDLLAGGLLIGTLAPFLCSAWVSLVWDWVARAG